MARGSDFGVRISIGHMWEVKCGAGVLRVDPLLRKHTKVVSTGQHEGVVPCVWKSKGP